MGFHREASKEMPNRAFLLAGLSSINVLGRSAIGFFRSWVAAHNEAAEYLAGFLMIGGLAVLGIMLPMLL
jgi:hypothetical protein